MKSVLPSGMGKAFFLLLMRHVLQRGSGICHHPVDERPVDAEGGHLLGEDALGPLEPFLAAESDSFLDALFAAALDLVVHKLEDLPAHGWPHLPAGRQRTVSA